MAKILNFLTSPKVFLTSLIPSRAASLIDWYCVGLGICGSGVFRNSGNPNPSHHKALVTNTKVRIHGLHALVMPKKPVIPTTRCTTSIRDPPAYP